MDSIIREPYREMRLLELWRADLRAMIINRGYGRLGYACANVIKFLLYPRIQAVLLFRLGHWFLVRKMWPFAYYLQGCALSRCGAEIHPAACIGEGFCLVHSAGVVIGDRAEIGAHFVCFQEVTVGDSRPSGGMPKIGNHVTACAGAKILGPITIGDGAIIGANAVVLSDVPPGAVAVGIPARVVPTHAVVSASSNLPV